MFCVARYDDYWRIKHDNGDTKEQMKEKLVKAGYDVKRSWTREELLVWVKRVQLGRLCYGKCDGSELKGFAVARSLMKPSMKRSKAWMARILMNGDDQRKFKKLMELPPELRKMVYEFYISDFQNESLLMPTQPPLARISMAMRNEILPVFYSFCEFDLLYQSSAIGSFGSPRFRLDDETFVFLSTLAPGYMGNLQKLYVEIADDAGYMEWSDLSFSIDLNTASHSWSDERKRPSHMFDQHLQTAAEIITPQLEKQITEMSKRKQSKTIALNDFHDLGKALEKGCKLSYLANLEIMDH